MEHKIISGTHGSVHYWVKGQGDNCILFTHGATMDHGLFRYQIEYFSQHYRVGDADRTGRVQTYCRRWAEREKRLLEIIANAAHNTSMDNPDEFNQILGDFLKKTELESTLPNSKSN